MGAPRRHGRRARGDEGQALPLLAGVLAMVASLLVGLVALGDLVGDRARAQTAADAAALAGAAGGREAAVAVVVENHGELRSFVAEGAEVEVVVRVGDAEATARAERSW